MDFFSNVKKGEHTGLIYIARAEPDTEKAKVIKFIGGNQIKILKSTLIRKLGLSSTGFIKLIGKYHLTEKSKLGDKNDLIFHFIQQDLFGGRLFWSCLVNLNNGKMQVLYHVKDPDKYGKIIEIKITFDFTTIKKFPIN